MTDTIVERDDSTNRPRRLVLGLVNRPDLLVNIKVAGREADSSIADRVVRVTPQELAEDLTALDIPGFTATYEKPPIPVPQGFGAVVLDSADEPYMRQYGGSIEHMRNRAWLTPSRVGEVSDDTIRDVLARGGRVISEGVEL